jgi:hypothetical protein
MGLKGLNRDLSRMLAPWTMVAMMFALNACQSGISHRDTDSLSSFFPTIRPGVFRGT